MILSLINAIKIFLVQKKNLFVEICPFHIFLKLLSGKKMFPPSTFCSFSPSFTLPNAITTYENMYKKIILLSTNNKPQI
jgi:hypothetical protein